jgi:bifunctional non-homologous end joining protein LigD
VSLEAYRRKRNFNTTREPPPEDSAPAAGRAIFVVQLHHASRRHFDFRLQVGDTLKSWAVPKGPSFNPSVKRLAVEVEDHPIAYAQFEGDIAAGYGKGHVDRFDHGVWATTGDAQAQLEKGHLQFELFGQRLKGGWHLVRSGRRERQPAWFLVKAQDRFAGTLEADDLLDARMTRSTRKAARSVAEKTAAAKISTRKKPLPTAKKTARPTVRLQLAKAAAALEGAKSAAASSGFYRPELARIRQTPPTGERWLHEVKWDGYRILAAVADGAVHLWSRNALAWNARLPEIVASIGALGLHSARLDGELIALGSDGRSDLSHVPLVARKGLLQTLLAKAPGNLRYSSHSVGAGEEAFAMANAQQLEGIVSKRADSGYRAGRGDDWLKVKRVQSDEFAVVGYTLPKGSRSGFGSLLLARPDPSTRAGWSYVGRVGSGFTDAQLRQLGKTLARHGVTTPTVALEAVDPELRGALWVPPTIVAEVYYRGIGTHHLLRQPSLKTLRMDKLPTDLRDPDRAPDAKKKPSAAPAKQPAGQPAQITISHPERVVFAEDGITKQQVADYYTAVMDWFLPGVIDRPTSVIRCPEGTAKPCFFQKHLVQGLHHVGTVRLKQETGAQAVYIYPRNAASVIELVQFGALEFHPWGATVQQPDRADRVVFDLDPGPDVAWARVTAAARLVRDQLQAMGLQSYLRTTGGKGLHVVVPLKPACRWETVKGFAQAFAATLAQAHPLEFVATATKARRGGKIYVDYLRNSRGATSVASYSLRARAGAPVAMPLRWTELGKLRSGAAFNIVSTPRRLARLKSDPWAGMASLTQNLDDVLRDLQRKKR